MSSLVAKAKREIWLIRGFTRRSKDNLMELILSTIRVLGTFISWFVGPTEVRSSYWCGSGTGFHARSLYEVKGFPTQLYSVQTSKLHTATTRRPFSHYCKSTLNILSLDSPLLHVWISPRGNPWRSNVQGCPRGQKGNVPAKGSGPRSTNQPCSQWSSPCAVCACFPSPVDYRISGFYWRGD